MVRKSKKTFVKNTPAIPKKERVPKTSKVNTRSHVICDCNLCQGRKVDPRTRALHMEREPTRNIDMGTGEGSRNVSDGHMEIDEMEISDDNYSNHSDNSGSEHEFNFLVKPKQSKGRGKQKQPSSSNIGFPLVVIEHIEHLLSDSDEDRDDEDDDRISIDEDNDDSSRQTVHFDAPEFADDDNADIPITNIDQKFVWIVYWIFRY